MKDEEIRLLKEQNEMLKEQLNKKNCSGKGLMIFIILVLAIGLGVCTYFLIDNNSSNSNNNNSIQESPKEKQCVKWKTTWNYSYCEKAYNTPSYCKQTGQECVEWK